MEPNFTPEQIEMINRIVFEQIEIMHDEAASRFRPAAAGQVMRCSDDQAALTARIFLLLSASDAVLSVSALSSGSLLVRRICCTDSFCSAR